MDIEILKGALEMQLETNSIRRGTVKARTFEYAFVMGVMATCAARNKQPPAYLTVMAMSGRSLLESHWSNDSTH